MQYITVVATLFASVALSSPIEVQERQLYVPCSGLYGTAQCCATDVLGVADLNCADPPTVPTDASVFQADCAAIGQQARCCVLPILEQGVLCNTPAGVVD
ncbi:fungal hydrophobin [Diaporthe helianthi]|uniref:Fungal hydrophobin n=1 Tax=Diaporthe helianthi TaxID=158607 RepID=A0A2P5HPU0_DIAHE|nr:fungal hydrophobin [Diaporthe helianthi]